MRVLAGLFFVVLLGAAASAADLKVKVVDPQSAALAGAQVNLMPASGGKILATQNTSAEGAALFRMPTGAVSADYKVQVLAPGFAAETVAVASQTEITVRLRLATAAETVVVTATPSMPVCASRATIENVMATLSLSVS